MMKITLSGHYEKAISAYTEEGRLYDKEFVQLPIRVTVEVKDGQVKFNLWDYDSLYDGDDPKKKRITHKGQFRADLNDVCADSHEDMSGGTWHNIKIFGEYVSWAGKSCELRISQAQYNTRLTDAWVIWPRKRFSYRGCPVDMTSGESTLLHLDAKSQIEFDELWKGLINEQTND